MAVVGDAVSLRVPRTVIFSLRVEKTKELQEKEKLSAK